MNIKKIMHDVRKIGFFLFMSLGFHVHSAKINSIEIQENAGKTSLLFRLDQPIKHKVFTLTNPDRVVVDFESANVQFKSSSVHSSNKLIKSIRSGRPNPNTLRLVFDVTDSVMLQTRSAGATAVKNAFYLDLSARLIKPGVIKKSEKTPLKPKPLVQVPPTRIRDVIVILDPGHGGKDPGAIGPRRTAEKNVTLAIAYKLKQIIDKQPGMRAILTRKSDYYVGLRERLGIARKNNGDVFISIHADAFINRQSNGVSVFALSQRGATSEAARWLAEKENYSELGGVNLRNLDDQSGLVRTVLIDLSQTATIAASLHMGETVLHHLDAMTNLHNHKVEQARFMVLKSPDIPSILIETGFISNPREEQNLSNARYQARLTQSIFEGLKQYFWEYPPHGTRIELMQNKQAHIVHAGDTLPEIASQYHVSVAAIQSLNHLDTLKIDRGQTLLIPKV